MLRIFSQFLLTIEVILDIITFVVILTHNIIKIVRIFGLVSIERLFINETKNVYIVIGFMLFALFFGAANLIYPAFLGIYSGHQILWSIIGFV